MQMGNGVKFLLGVLVILVSLCLDQMAFASFPDRAHSGPLTVTISSTDVSDGGTYDSSVTVTFTLSMASSDFTKDDVTVTNGSPAEWISISAKIYTVKVTPIFEGDVTVQVGEKKFKDGLGNSNITSDSFTWTHDTSPPQVQSIVRVTSSGVATGDTSTDPIIYFKVTFDEDAYNLSPDDFALFDTWYSVLNESVVSVSTLNSPDQSEFLVAVSVGGQEGQLRLDFDSGTNVVDIFGHVGSVAYPGEEQYFCWNGDGVTGVKLIDSGASVPPPADTYFSLHDAIDVFNQFGKGSSPLTYRVKAGTYYEFNNFVIQKSGHPNDPVRFEPDGGTVVFKSTGQPSSHIFDLQGSWLTLDGFTFDANNQEVISVTGTNNRIQKCSIEANASYPKNFIRINSGADFSVVEACSFSIRAISIVGFIFNGVQVLGEDCEILNNNFFLVCEYYALLHAVNSTGGASLDFRGNYVSYKTWGFQDGLYAVLLPLGGTFEQNYVHLEPFLDSSGAVVGAPKDTFSGVKMGGNCVVRNNVIFNFPAHQFEFVADSTMNLQFDHNTLYQANTNATATSALLYITDGGGTIPKSNFCRNNIFYDAGDPGNNCGVYAPPGILSMSNNLYYMPKGAAFGNDGSNQYKFKDWESSSGEEASLDGNPLFESDVDGAENFSITSLSPARDAGTFVVGIDMDGESRSTVTPDIGADEFYDYAAGGGNISYSPGSPDLPSGGCGALGVEGLLLAFLLRVKFQLLNEMYSLLLHSSTQSRSLYLVVLPFVSHFYYLLDFQIM